VAAETTRDLHSEPATCIAAAVLRRKVTHGRIHRKALLLQASCNLTLRSWVLARRRQEAAHEDAGERYCTCMRIDSNVVPDG